VAKRKAAGAATKATQPSAAGVLPKPQLVGVEPAAPRTSGVFTAAKSPEPKHEPTLIGLPKHLPTALPPLRASVPAPSPAPSKPESSLVGLSKQLVNAARGPKTGIRVKAPAPPPTAHNAESKPAAHKRHAADPTDYDVHIIGAYATPPLPANPNLDRERGPHATSHDNSWEADVELLEGKTRPRALFVGLGLAVLCAVGVAIYFYAGRTPQAPAVTLKSAVPLQAAISAEPTAQATTPAAVVAPSAPIVPAAEPPMASPQSSPPSDAWLSPKPAKIRAKKHLRKRAAAHRARAAHRKASR